MVMKDLVKLAIEAGAESYELGKRESYLNQNRYSFDESQLTKFAELLQAQSEKSLEQILTDEENQPSQYGTVPLSWYEKAMTKYNDVADKLVAPQPQASEPVAWIKPDFRGNGYAELDKKTEWKFSPTIVKHEPIPLYTSPPNTQQKLDKARDALEKIKSYKYVEHESKATLCYIAQSALKEIE